MQATASLLAGVAVAAALAPPAAPGFWPLVGRDVAAVVYLTRVWWVSWPCDAGEAGRLANREDPTRALVDALLLVTAVPNLGGVGLAVAGSAEATVGARAQTIGLGVITAALSWALVNTVFTLRYARLYYGGEPGGITWPSPWA